MDEKVDRACYALVYGLILSCIVVLSLFFYKINQDRHLPGVGEKYDVLTIGGKCFLVSPSSF